ncbi:glycosyltransferase family 2 protein [Halalkalibacter sp. AB-rgal2]|uniref:glycosyltransferase family 2 protein n=1 Tax=Halalkalibacter sp. AB-rgal2 TaxID=3242695 RepID=UPI00359E10A4
MGSSHCNKPIISVCCMTYNHESFISDAIESFLMQKTDFDFEIIIHDDASTDKTKEIVEYYEKKYPNIIKPIYQNENQYSKGIRRVTAQFLIPKAKGKYIALCEGDDYWTDPYKLQKQFDYMEANPTCSLCTHATKVITFNKMMNEEEDIRKPSDNNIVRSNDEIIMQGAEINHTSSFFFQKRIFNDLPNWYFYSTGDDALRLLCISHGYVSYLDGIMSVYRKGIVGSWSNRVRNHKWNRIKLYENKLKLLDEFNKSTLKLHDGIITKKKQKVLYTLEFYKKIANDGEIWARAIINYMHKQKDKAIKVAIFGVADTAKEIKKHLNDHNVGVSLFLDNYHYGQTVENVHIVHPESLVENKNGINLVIITVWGKQYVEIKKQLLDYNPALNVLTMNDISEY